MKTRDSAKAQAFVEYALDTEGMQFNASRFPDGTWVIGPETGTRYDNKMIEAVWRNFQQEWKMMTGR